MAYPLVQYPLMNMADTMLKGQQIKMAQLQAQEAQRQQKARLESTAAAKSLLGGVSPGLDMSQVGENTDPNLLLALAGMANARQKEDLSQYWANWDRGAQEARTQGGKQVLGQLYPGLQLPEYIDPQVASALMAAKAQQDIAARNAMVQEKQLGLTAQGVDIQRQQLARQQEMNQFQMAKIAAEIKNMGGPNVEHTAKFRDKFIAESKPWQEVKSNFNRVLASADPDAPQENRAQNDMSMVFAYMKLLDPNSVVRESEYATAEQARGVPDSIINTYNKLVSGQKLTDTQRQGFVKNAYEIIQGDLSMHKQRESEYSRWANEFGMKPSQVVQDYTKDFYDIINKPKNLKLLGIDKSPSKTKSAHTPGARYSYDPKSEKLIPSGGE